MFFWSPAWQMRRTHTYKPVSEKLVFLWFSTELLNCSRWHLVLFASFPLGQRVPHKRLFPVCSHKVSGFLQVTEEESLGLSQSLPFSNNFMYDSSRHPTPGFTIYPCPWIRRDLFLKLYKSSASSENDFRSPPPTRPPKTFSPLGL